MGAGKTHGGAGARPAAWAGGSRTSTSASRRVSGESVAAIFAQHGEPYFRQLERQVLSELLPERNVVVATGGGTFAEADNRALMLADGAVAWLDVPLAQRARARARPTAGGRWPRTARRWSSCSDAASWRTRRRTCASTAHEPVPEVVERLLEWIGY